MLLWTTADWAPIDQRVSGERAYRKFSFRVLRPCGFGPPGSKGNPFGKASIVDSITVCISRGELSLSCEA
jgi:hypothetical protein